MAKATSCQHPDPPDTQSFVVHPYEMALVGVESPIRTRLAKDLVEQWSQRRSVAVVHHAPAATAEEDPGPALVACTRGDGYTVMTRRTDGNEESFVRWNLLDADLALIESARPLPVPTILVLDRNEFTFEHLSRELLGDVPFVVGEIPIDIEPQTSFRAFRPDDVDDLVEAADSFLLDRARQVPLYGLVLTGGKSTRMGRDKAALTYRGQPQSVNTFELLKRHCRKVYLSNRPEQSDAPGHQGLPQIHDTIIDAGPMGGILSAFRTHPQACWLVTACDLPYLDDSTLTTLLDHRDPFKMATAFSSAVHHGLPEPLCTLYEPKSYFRLMHFLASGIQCPRKALLNSDIRLVPAANPKALENINRPTEYEAALREVES